MRHDEKTGYRRPGMVTAQEIACYAYCPEQWRLQYGLGLEPANRAGAGGRRPAPCPDGGGGVGVDHLAGNQPVEQHPQGRQVLLDGRDGDGRPVAALAGRGHQPGTDDLAQIMTLVRIRLV